MISDSDLLFGPPCTTRNYPKRYIKRILMGKWMDVRHYAPIKQQPEKH